MSLPQMAKPGYIEYQGQAQLYSDKITQKVVTGNKPQLTNLLGLAGKSDGAVMASLDVSSAVPQAGYEFDAEGLALAQSIITLAFRIAGYRTEIEGWIEDASTTTGAEGQTELTFTFTGKVVSRAQI